MWDLTSRLARAPRTTLTSRAPREPDLKNPHRIGPIRRAEHPATCVSGLRASLRSATPSIPRAMFIARWTGRFAHHQLAGINPPSDEPHRPSRRPSSVTRARAAPRYRGLALLGDPQIGGSSNETTIPDLRFILPRVKMEGETGAGNLKRIKCSRVGLIMVLRYRVRYPAPAPNASAPPRKSGPRQSARSCGPSQA